MTVRNIAATLAGLIVMVASTMAGVAIWLLLTAPTAIGRAMDGSAAGPVPLAVRAFYAALSHFVGYQ
jgi:hypothetical protein